MNIRFVRILCMILLAMVSQAVAGVTYVAGPCKPGAASFPSISAALAAVPPPTTVMVCPGTYNEQVVITNAVNLVGIASVDSGQAIIAVPSAGLVVNATARGVVPAAAQIWVNAASGTVNISNLIVDAAGNNLTTGVAVGILYQGSSGTMNHVVTRNQNFGVGMEGGSTTPSVTLENSFVQAFASLGVYAETYGTGTSQLAALIKNDDVVSTPPAGGAGAGKAQDGVLMGPGATATVAGNFISGVLTGILADTSAAGYTAAGSASGNMLTNVGIGIEANSNAVPFTSNKIYGATAAGVDLANLQSTLGVANTTVVQSNVIESSVIGIEFNCNADPTVLTNTLVDTVTGLDQVPGGTVFSATYFTVATDETICQ